MFYKVFDKKTNGSGATLTNKSVPQNEQFAEELHKPLIRKFIKTKSIFSIQRQYLGCRFSRYAINK